MSGKIQLCAMKIGVAVIVPLVLMTLLASGGELPIVLVDGLAAEDFKEREDSQSKLLEWAKKEKKSPAPAFHQLSKTSDEPEVRQRCYEILKSLSDQDYLSDGKGFLGITMLAGIVNLPGEEKQRNVVRITNIVKNGPAEKIGLKVGDAITSLDGKVFRNEDVLREFSGAIAAMKPLDEVVIGVKRAGGKVEDLKVILARHPGENLNAFPRNLHLLDERARENHFEMWLKKLDEKG